MDAHGEQTHTGNPSPPLALPSGIKILAWNCQGLGRTATRRNLYEIKRNRNPNIVFLSETKKSKGRMTPIKRRLNLPNCLEVEARGKSGGLALLWDEDVKLRISSYSTNHIDATIDSPEGIWRLTGVYGFPESSRKVSTFRLLESLRAGLNVGPTTDPNLPWCLIGDFNCLLSDSEKNEGPRYHRQGMEAFRDFMMSGNFSDLDFKGDKYTWKHDTLRERLDRSVADQAWLAMFPNYELRVLARIGSDHNPIFLTLHVGGGRKRKKKRFRFENMWLQEARCKEIIQEVWKSGKSTNQFQSIMENISEVSSALEKWNKLFFGNVQKRLADCQKRYDELRSGAISEEDIEEEQLVLQEIESFLEREEISWSQRAKEVWLREGDRNTAYFHRRSSTRKKRNRVTGLFNDQQEWVTDQGGMRAIVAEYFSSLFASTDPTGLERVDELLECRVSEAQNVDLMRPVTREEVAAAVKEMNPAKSPGPDGMNPKFFQAMWETMGDEIFKSVEGFFNGTMHLPGELNKT